MNINFGLTEYGRIDFMMKLSEMLKEKKRYEILKKEKSDKKYYQGKIDEM